MATYHVILLPGGVLPAEVAYARLIEKLESRATCIAKELEIYRADVPPGDYALDLEVAGVLSTAADAGFDGCHLVGYSFGGAVALATAAHDPERVASLSLFEPAPIRTLETSPEGDAMWLEIERMMSLPPQQRMRAQASMLLKPGTVPPSPPSGPPPPWMASRTAAFERLLGAPWFYPLDLEALTRFQGPVYVGLGTLTQPPFERQARRLAELLPQVQIEAYEGLHHLNPPHLAEPERFANALLQVWADASQDGS